MARLRPDPRRAAPPLLAAALAALYLLWQPPSIDLAAADYRSWLFGRDGFAVWDLGWYGGHHLPGYSVLLPPLGWWLGTRLTGALAVVAATLLFERLARGRFGARAWVGALWFAIGAASSLFSGRLTFTLGLVPGLAALLALERALCARGERRRRVLLALALLCALLTPLTSPVAALFVALAGAAHAAAAARTPDGRWVARAGAPGLALAGAALAPIGAFALAFPEGGAEPFALASFWPVLAAAAVALLLVPREERALRIGIALYALGSVAAFALATPVGGNVVRLGALCAGPLLALVLWRRRMLALALLVPLLAWWQVSSAIEDVSTASGDASVGAAYYAPLLARVQRAGGPPGRLEIPFTRLHWEAWRVAPSIPLARGWERQLDIATNGLFYGPPARLTPARYRAWLDRMAVRWVALPDARLDYSALAEARLIRRGVPYLREVWRGAHWRLYAVRDPVPLVQPPGRALALTSDALALAAPRPATLLVRVRWTPYWAIGAGDACVEPAGGWTRVRVRRPGRVRLVVRFSLGRVGARAARCANR